LAHQGLLDPPRDTLTEQQVLDSLAWNHSTQIRWNVDLLSTALEPTGIDLKFDSGSVSWQWRAQPNPGDAPVAAVVRRQATLVYRHLPGFNPLAVLYRPWVEMRAPDGTWVRWHLGVFTAILPPYRYDGLSDEDGPVVWRDLQLADRSHIWQTDTTSDSIVVTSGTNIPLWVRDDIATRFDVADTTQITGTGTATIDYVFEPETSWLDVYGTILGAVGNEPLYADQDGRPASAPLVDPETLTPDVTYNYGSTVVPSATVESVNPDLPNTLRFVARRGPSLAEEGNGIRTVVNESVGPGSLQQRGDRTVLQRVEVDAQTQDDLEAQAKALAPFYFAGGGLRYVGEVGLDPRHDDRGVVQLERPPMGISGTWLVTAWTVRLGDVGQMKTMQLELEQLTGSAFVSVADPVLGAAGTFAAGHAMAGGDGT
jgi:hypothetical protein